MKRFFPVALILIFLISPGQKVFAWGFWAHQRINRLAVFTLPQEMLPFFKKHIEYLTEHAVDPDHRRYAVEGEAERHYIDLDRYGELPFENVPRKWKEAVAKYTEDSLRKHGIVPWHIPLDYYRLVEAFKAKDVRRILKIAADLGHYVADSHVPLHTTENYNGQLTGQRGIHGLWESRIPEIWGLEYDYYVGQASFIEHPLDEAWKTVLESHAAVDSVLEMERDLTAEFPSDRKYSFENRNSVLVKVYSREFCDAYSKMMDGMVERRLRASVSRVGCFWYSAWVEAGQPNLKSLMGEDVEPEDEKNDPKLKIQDREAGDVGMNEPLKHKEDHWGCEHSAQGILPDRRLPLAE